MALPAVEMSMLNVFPMLFHTELQRPKVVAYLISASDPAPSLGRW